MKQKILLLLVSVFITCISLFSQPAIKYQKVIGGTSDDYLTGVTLTNDGGLIAGGYSLSGISGNKSESGKGGYDYWIVKMDSLGKIEWDKTIGGSGNDALWLVEQTGDGGYILGGESSSNKSGQKSENSRGGQDYWIVKLDKNGNVIWDKTLGGSGAEWSGKVMQTADGGYMVGGYSYSDISGEKTSASRGLNDYWVVKLDASGNIEWDKTMGGNAADFLTTFEQSNDGGYMIGGYSYSNISGEKTSNTYGIFSRTDYWIIKLDGSGNIQWDKTIGGDGYDYLQSLKQTNDNGYILGGRSQSDKSGNKSDKIRGEDDFWVVKTDEYGNVVWDKTIGGNDRDELYDIEQTSDSGYICAGISVSGISSEKSEANRGARDYWVVKLDKNGILQFDKTIGGSGDDIAYSVKEVQKNKFVIAGYSGSKKSGDKTIKPIAMGSYDFWLVGIEYKHVTSNNVAESNNRETKIQNYNSHKSFFIYPNPVKDILHIQNTGKTIITLTDQSGKQIFTKTINGNEDINVSQLHAGLYYLKNNNTDIVEKVIVIK